MQKADGNVGKVFPYWHMDTISHYFKKFAKKAGINARLHDLRHTFASHLALKGETLRTIQDLLGHSDIRTTLQYSHLTIGHLREAANKLDFET